MNLEKLYKQGRILILPPVSTYSQCWECPLFDGKKCVIYGTEVKTTENGNPPACIEDRPMVLTMINKELIEEYPE